MKTVTNTSVISKALGRFSSFIYLHHVIHFLTLSTSSAARHMSKASANYTNRCENIKMKYLLISALMFSFLTPKKNKDQYWHQLILSTGYTNSIKDLSKYQLDFLEKIKTNFPKIEQQAYKAAKEELDSFYGDDNPISTIDLNGLNLPEDTTNIWELYFECYGEDKYLIPIVIFKNFEIQGTTSVN